MACVRSHICEGERNILYKGVETSTGRCDSEEDEPRRGVDTRRCGSKGAGPKGKWIGESHIGWRRERVSSRTLNPEGGGLWDPTLVEEENSL